MVASTSMAGIYIAGVAVTKIALIFAALFIIRPRTRLAWTPASVCQRRALATGRPIGGSWSRRKAD